MKYPAILSRIGVAAAALLMALAGEAQTTVTQVVAAGDYSLFIKSDGSLWGMGKNTSGQLGDGTFGGSLGYTNKPEQITNNVIAVAAGDQFSLFIKSDGSLWATGYDVQGQLGNGTNMTTAPNGIDRAQQIVPSNVVAVAAGAQHSLFIKSDGTLWGMGDNTYGQLGDGTYNATNLPELITNNVIAVAAGEYHTLFLKNDGTLWVTGWNYFGQLGDGTTTVMVNQPEQVASNVTAIATEWLHDLFIKENGSLWGMGYNYDGELGDGYYDQTNMTEMIVPGGVMAIATGSPNSLFIKRGGSLWAMGSNGTGELGDGTTDDGNYRTNHPEQILPGGVTAIAAGAGHSLFIMSDGSLWGMGYDIFGQLGDGTSNTTNKPILIVPGVPAGYDTLTGKLLGNGKVQLAYVGLSGTNYVLDRTFSLTPPVWVPQATNTADTNDMVLFTNVPNATLYNFWRVHSAP